MEALPSQSYLRECFSYNPETGDLYWLPRPACHFPTDHGQKVFNGAYAGKKISTMRDDGYLVAGIDGKCYTAHRIIYKYWHGVDPEVVDHINHDRADNRISNLRSVTIAENVRHRKSPVKGICYDKRCKAWMANLCVKGKKYYLGRHKKMEDAIKARKDAEAKYLAK